MADYTLADLEALSGIPARTIRYYIAQGLLPSPGREGPSTRYAEGTLQRLRLIARLRDSHLPLAAIRSRLTGLDDTSIASLAEAPPEAASAATDSALDYVRRLLGQPPGGAAGAAPSPSTSATPPPPAAAAAPPGAGGSQAGPVVPPTPLRGTAEPDRSPMRKAIRGSTPAVPAPLPVPASTAHGFGERSQWDRIAITPDIELHVRRPLTRADNRLVERLLAFARQFQEETK